MKDDPMRTLTVAKTLAELCNDSWETLVRMQRQHYQNEAAIVLKRLNKYDHEARSIAIRNAHAKAIAEGKRGPGRPPGSVEPRVAALEGEARRMVLEQKTTRDIRKATGLGNSTITRIKSDVMREQANGMAAE